MKTGLGIQKKIRKLIAYINLIRFKIRKILFGFDYANLLLRSNDKISLQYILQKNGAKIGKNCDLETGITFHNCKDYSNLIVGNNCHIGKNCFFDLREKIKIGNNVVISMQSTFLSHLDLSQSLLSQLYPSESKGIIIDDDCYIGANSIILMGVNLSKASFIAAGSVVTKEVPPYTMVGGVPARIIKKLV